MKIRETLLLLYFVKFDYMCSKKRTHPEVDATFAMLLPLVFLVGIVLSIIYIQNNWDSLFNYFFVIALMLSVYSLARYLFRDDEKYRILYTQYKLLPPGKRKTYSILAYSIDVASLVGTLLILIAIRNYASK